MELRRISDPLTQDQKLAVVPPEEVKLAARISHSEEDALIRDDIEAAYDFLAGPNGEGWLNGCRLLEEEWEVFLPSNIGSTLGIPLRPIKGSVAGGSPPTLEWMQGDGSYLPVDAAAFGFCTVNGATDLLRWRGRSWPYVGTAHPHAYRLRFTAGFGTTRESIPSGLRKAIRMLATHWFINRETVGSEGKKVGDEVLYGLRKLAGQYRFSPDHS